jgi:hypothetical protein
VVVGHVESGVDTVFPDKAMTYRACGPIGPHNLALRVERAALRENRSGRVERGEGARAPEVDMCSFTVGVGSSELVVRAYPVDRVRLAPGASMYV